MIAFVQKGVSKVAIGAMTFAVLWAVAAFALAQVVSIEAWRRWPFVLVGAFEMACGKASRG